MEEELIEAAEPTITLVQQEEESILPTIPEPQMEAESTAEDYWNIVNPAAIAYNNPEVKFNAATDLRGDLGFNDEDFQAVYSQADVGTQRAMLKANNKSDALKIAHRRDIFNASMKSTEDDGMLTQLGMGILPAIASPTSLLPLGAVYKGAQLAKTVSRLQSAAVGVGAGAVTGAVANIADEALFDMQGMPTNYVGAGAIGAVFGGFLGGLGGAIVGPSQNTVARAIAPENDTFTRDYTSDPSLVLELDENGIPKIQDIGKMNKSIVDRIPWVGAALRSDVHTVYQSDSSLLRGFMGRMSDPTVALKDAEGNLVVTKKTAKNFQRTLKGHHNNLTDEVSQLHETARSRGYDGDIEQFNSDVWVEMATAMNKQREELSEYIKQKTAGMQTEPIQVTEGNINFFNKVPGASGEGVGAVRKRNYVMTEKDRTYTREVPTGEVEEKTGLDVIDSILEDFDVIGTPKTEVKTFTRTDAEMKKMQEDLDVEWADFKKSIEEEGIKNDIVIGYRDGKLTIEEGNHRLTAANELGIENIPVRYMDNVPEELKFVPTTKTVDPDVRALNKAAREAEKEFYDNYEFKFKDTEVGKAAESHRVYFEKMLSQGQAINLKGMQNIHKNKLYVPRTYNYKGIQRGDVSQEVARAEVRAGLENHPENVGMTGKELDIAVEEVMKMLNESAFDLNNLTTSFMVKDLPFESRLKQRKLNLNESYMPNIVNSNLGDLVGAYHYQIQGRQGLQFAFGTDKVEEVMKLVRDEHLDKGILYAEKEIQAFERTVQDVLGTLRMNQLADTPSWTFTRNLTSFNSARLGGGFGGNQFIELASSIAMQGTKALLTGRLFKSLKSTSDLLYMKKGTNDEFTQFIINSGYMENALHTSRVNRYADTESGFNSGWLENKLNFVNDKLMKYNGMRYFLGVMEDYTGAAIVTQLKSGKMPLKRLARWGLSEADAKNLQTKLKEVTTDENWDLGALSQLERDQLQLAVTKGIEEIVVQGDSIHLPAWMKAPGQFTKVLTQFMRFPMVAQETLLRRGMTDEQAQLASGTFSAIGAYLGIKYLREQASLSMGTVHPADTKYEYDKFTQEDWERAIGEALNYTAPLGFMTSVWNYGAVATGSPELGREWQSKNGMSSLLGPSGGLGEDLIQLMRAGVEGELTTERNFKRFRSLVPFMNLPLIKEGSDAIIEEYGD